MCTFGNWFGGREKRNINRYITNAQKVNKRSESELVKIRNFENGVDLCLRNAERLIRDAELLFEHESYGHAASLVCLGPEELGKALELSAACFFGKEVEDKNSVFRSHKNKIALSAGAMLGPAIVEAFRAYAKEKGVTKESLQEFALETELIPMLTKAIPETDRRRKAGLYVDYKNGKWISPFEIRRKEAKSLVDSGIKCLTKMGSMCRALIRAAPLRNKFYSEFLKRCKKALDEGEISQELYDMALSGWEALGKK